MVPADEFIRHAAECESIAKSSRDPENKKVWRRMAERWTRCAELAQKQEPLPQSRSKRKLDRKPALARSQ
jgi:ferric-dicitrate binding protein FerR (iron transport regulator)